ncbi:MAG: Fur family transcriptional regulator [Hyphomicrobiaceae bacterium]
MTNLTSRERLIEVGLRPTRQRLELARLLFGAGDRHVTAEALHEEASASGILVSLATVYNTLHQFTQVGLLRSFAVDGQKTYFDTNTTDHHHFYCEWNGQVLDMPSGNLEIGGLPLAPDGTEVVRVDVVVRLASKA